MKKLARYKARRAMQQFEKHAARYYGSIEEAILAQMRETDQKIHSFLSEPSQREIARALNMPKSTVADAIMRLRKAGLTRGRWSV